MANYSDNQVVFFSENKEAVYDLWQKINDYINNSKTRYPYILGHKIDVLQELLQESEDK